MALVEKISDPEHLPFGWAMCSLFLKLLVHFKQLANLASRSAIAKTETLSATKTTTAARINRFPVDADGGA
jgi:hypothetical protein